MDNESNENESLQYSSHVETKSSRRHRQTQVKYPMLNRVVAYIIKFFSIRDIWDKMLFNLIKICQRYVYLIISNYYA